MDISDRGVATVLALSGDVDIHTAPAVRDRLAELRSDGVTTLVVDLSGVDFLDSSALGALVVSQRELQAAGGSLRLACPRPHVQKVFRITRLADVIPTFDTLEAACS